MEADPLVQIGIDSLTRRVGRKRLDVFLMLFFKDPLERLLDFCRVCAGVRAYEQPEPRPSRAVERLHVHRRRHIDIGDSSRLSSDEAFGRDADDLVRLTTGPERLTDGAR